jgi:hypothetical protein
MKKRFLFFLCYLSYLSNAFSQSEKFDIATFIPPKGWQRLDSAGVLAFHDYRARDGQTSFCQIVLFPSWQSKNSPSKNFQQEWKNRVTRPTSSNAKPAIQTEVTPDGWTVVTGAANLSVSGMSYACILATISGFNKAMSIMVNTAGNDYGAQVEQFFNSLELSSNAEVINKSPVNGGAGSGVVGISISDYEFTAPENWQIQNNGDHIQIQSMESGCLIQMLEPQPSSGNLEEDAMAVFNMMYPAANWRYTQEGEKKYVLLRGYLTSGLRYAMMEAPMNTTAADGKYHTEDGAALVIHVESQIVIVSVRHSSLVSHWDCANKYNSWRRFFNSFDVKGVPRPNYSGPEPAKRIVGVWKLLNSGMSLGEYVFAANGNYQFTGAVGTSSTTSGYYYDYLHLTTYAFEGDGSYSFDGNKLITQRRKGADPEQKQFRFEEANYGGTGWKDRINLLSDSTLGSPNEVCYEKVQK